MLLLAPRSADADRDELRATVLTFTPATHLFLLFGHTSLWIHDPRLPEEEKDLVYNFGTFAFGSPEVVPDFFRGKLRYWLSIAPLAWTLSTYGSEGRGIRAQELALSFAEVDALERDLIARAAPERRFYTYGYVVENCTTRVRDALNDATAGALARGIEEAWRSRPPTSYRAQVARVTADRPAPGLVIDAAMGPSMDLPRTGWDATFLPDHLAEVLPLVSRVDHVGNTVPLISRDYVKQAASRPVPTGPSAVRIPMVLLGGALPAALVLWLRARSDRSAPARSALAIVTAALGISAALTGAFWLLLGALSPWLRYNLNVLSAPPWLLLLAKYAPGIARGQGLATRRARVVAGAAGATTLLALALEAFHLTPQRSLPLLTTMLLLWSALVWSFGPVVADAAAPVARRD